MKTQTHECGCATFGPGPHPVDARHPNVRGCEHAETGLREAAYRLLNAIMECRARSEDAIENVGAAEAFEKGDAPLEAALVEFSAAENALYDALQAEPARAAQEKGEAG